MGNEEDKGLNNRGSEMKGIGYYNTDKKISGKITRKGQVTIPHEIRNFLGIEEGDRIAFIIKDNQEVVVLGVKKTNLDDLFGSLKPNKPIAENEDYLKIRDEAIEKAILDKWGILEDNE
jgi:antitoxin PrlF